MIVDDVDDVQRLTVLSVRAHVVQHFLNGPMLPHRDVVGRHQPSDRSFRVPQKGQRDGTFVGSQKRKQLLGNAGRQLLEEHRPVVGRHVVQQRGDVFLRHRLEQRLLRFP